ncbi:MAG: DUF6386 family protein [Sandaracinaceae bacterium]
MDALVTLSTDTATLVVADPQHPRLADVTRSWERAPLVIEGEVALATLGGDGGYRVRITDGGLRADERDYACDRARGGVVVSSGRLRVAAGEWIDGDALPDGRGIDLSVTPGAYLTTLYRIGWRATDGWAPDAQPADVVILLEPSAGVVDVDVRLAGTRDFLFESTTRRVGPSPGAVLTTAVRRGKDRLTLKDVYYGVGFFRVDLRDWSGVQWKDEVDVRVLEVDVGEKLIWAELVARRPRG